MFLPVLSVVLMALSYNTPSESTDVFPLELNMYRHPKALYSSKAEKCGIHYKNSVDYFGGFAEEVQQNTSVTQGNYNNYILFGKTIKLNVINLNQTILSALLDHAVQDIAKYRNNYIISAEFNVSDDDAAILANGFYSGIAVHSVPLTVNLLSNALIKRFSGDEYSIRVSSQQLPNPLSATILMPEAESLSRVLVFCSFFFPTVALFVIHPFQEMETKIKQLQRMTGVTSFSYWGTMFSFDFIILTMSIVIIMLGFYIMDIILDIRLYYRTETRKLILRLIIPIKNST